MITEMRKEQDQAAILNDLAEKIQQLIHINHIAACNLRRATDNITMVAGILVDKKIMELNAGNDPISIFSFDMALKYTRESSDSLLDILNILTEAADMAALECRKHNLGDPKEFMADELPAGMFCSLQKS